MSQSVNRVILVGRLGKDPEIKYTPSGQALAKFSIATDESYKDSDGNLQTQTEWHNVVVWRRQAEIAGEYLKKGTMVYLEGKLKTRSWEDAQGGGKRYATDIVADRFVMLSGKGEGGGDRGGTGSEGSFGQKNAPMQQTHPQPPDEDEDLPF